MLPRSTDLSGEHRGVEPKWRRTAPTQPTQEEHSVNPPTAGQAHCGARFTLGRPRCCGMDPASGTACREVGGGARRTTCSAVPEDGPPGPTPRTLADSANGGSPLVATAWSSTPSQDPWPGPISTGPTRVTRALGGQTISFMVHGCPDDLVAAPSAPFPAATARVAATSTGTRSEAVRWVGRITARARVSAATTARPTKVPDGPLPPLQRVGSRAYPLICRSAAEAITSPTSNHLAPGA